MATTGAVFVRHTNADLVGSTVGAVGAIQAVDPATASAMLAGGNVVLIGPSTAAAASLYPLNGASTLALPSTTKVVVDLTNLATAAASSAGDVTFALWKRITIKNTGAASFTVAPGSATPVNGYITGTTPTQTVQPGGTLTFPEWPTTGNVVDGTHKFIDITPSATTSADIQVSGA